MPDTLEQEYLDSANAREEASSPTAQLLRHRKEQLLNVYRKQKAAPLQLPEAGTTPPGQGGGARGVPAAPDEGGAAPQDSTEPGQEPAQEPTSGPGVVPSLGDALKQIPGGVLDTVKNLLRMPQEMAASYQRFNDDMLQALAESKGPVPPDVQAQLDLARTQPDADQRTAAVLAKVAGKLPEVKESDTLGGQLIRGLAGFLPVFGAARNATKTLPVVERLMKSSGTMRRAAGEAMAGGLAGIPADMAAFDPSSPRFSNLVESLAPALKNPVTEFLKAPELEEGQELELERRFTERLKNAAEGLVLGSALDVLVGSVIAARRLSRVHSAEKRFNRAIETATSQQRAGERAPEGMERTSPGEAIANEVNQRNGLPPLPTREQRFDAMADALMELHTANGGATFNLRSGDLGGTQAFAVGFAPDLSVPIPGHPTRDQIRAFIEKISQVVDLDTEHLSIGTFFENGQTDLDLVATPRDYEKAVEWGKAFNQRSVFDLQNFQTIDTGGTGLDLGNLPPLSDRLKVVLGANGSRDYAGSIRDLTERNGEAARQGLGALAMKWLRDETGSIRFGADGLSKPELRQLGLIGAAILARGIKSEPAFRRELESAFSVGGKLSLAERDVAAVRKEAEKVFQRNVDSAMRTAAKLSKELGDENTYHGLPNTGRLLQLFKDGKHAMGWYDDANTELARWFGKDADLMADLIAATSPRTNPERNVFEALEAYKQIKAGKSATEIEGVFAGPAASIKQNLVGRVLDGMPIGTPKAGAFAQNIKGDPNAVTIDVWMTRSFFGRDSIKTPQSEFLQEWVRQVAYQTGVAPREMQAAIWVGKRMEDEFKFADDPDFKPLRNIIRRQAEQAFQDGAMSAAPELRNDAGFTRLGTMWFLSRVSAGALYGASGQDRTMEDRVAGALYGAGVMAALSPSAAAKLIKGMTKVLTAEGPLQKGRRGGRSSAALGIASEPVRPEAQTFASLADEYAARVKEATRGVELDEETGLVKVRPREVQVAEAGEVREQMTPEAIQQLMPTIRLNDAESIAMAHVMTESGLRLRAMAQTVKATGYREEDVRELLKQVYVMGRMDPKRLGALAEAGRTLGALNEPVSGMNQFLNQFTELFKNANTTVTPQRMIDALSSFKGPRELAAFTRQLTRPGMADYFYEVWINGLLSGPRTWVTNGLGNATTLLYTVGERGMAAAMRTQGGVAPGEAGAMLHGVVQAHADALRAFWRIVRDADELPEASKLDQPRKVLTSDNLGMTGLPGRAVDLLGAAIRTPGRVLAGTDEYFKGIASRAELRAQARREAFNEVERRGLKGRSATDLMNSIENQFLADPPIAAMQRARQFAEYVTFTNELGETGKALQTLQRTPIGRVVIPFVRTPVNLFKFATERTGPLGLASSRLRAELNSADPAVRDLAKAKIALSSMTLSTMAVLAANGYVTGGGPTDPVLRKQWLSAGYLPYSFDVGAMAGRVGPPKPGDLVQAGRLDPIFMPYGMVADVVTMMGHLTPEERDDLGTALVVAFSKNFTSKTFVQGVARTTSAIADPDRMGASALKNFLTTLMPFSSGVRQAAQSLDPEARDADGLIEEYKKRVPGLSTSVPADLDLFGNPRFLGGGLGSDLVGPAFKPAVDFVMPIYVNTAAKEHQELFALMNQDHIRPAEAPKSLDGVPLTNVERAELKRIAGKELAPEGKTLPRALKALFQSPAFKAASPGHGEGREALTNIVIRGYYKAAGEVLQDRHKNLKRDIRDARVKHMRSMGVNPAVLDQIRSQIGVE